jgi:hypothetical protein
LFWHGHRKELNKVNERVVNSKPPFAVQVNNRVHRRAVLATMCILSVVILGTIIVNSGSSRTIAYANSISGVGVGIYWDHACTNRTLSLDWGLIEPGSSSKTMVYIRNEGNSAVSLWMTTSNWNPSAASGYLTLTWTYTDRILGAGEVIPMELILNVFHTVSGITDFSFDVVITATG